MAAMPSWPRSRGKRCIGERPAKRLTALSLKRSIHNWSERAPVKVAPLRQTRRSRSPGWARDVSGEGQEVRAAPCTLSPSRGTQGTLSARSVAGRQVNPLQGRRLRWRRRSKGREDERKRPPGGRGGPHAARAGPGPPRDARGGGRAGRERRRPRARAPGGARSRGYRQPVHGGAARSPSAGSRQRC